MNVLRKNIVSITVSLLSVTFIGCEDETQQQEVAQAEEVKLEDERITRKEIENLRYDDYGLSPDSQNATQDWQKYNEMIIQTDNLKKNDLTFFTNESTLVRTFLTDLRTEMPQALKSNEISARLTVVQTAMLKLNSLLNLDNIEKEDKLRAIKDYLVAVSNLNLLINNKFEFEANNIEKPK